RHGEHPDLLGRPHRADAGHGPEAERRGQLHPDSGGVPPEAPPAAGRLSDPRRRPEPYRRGDGGVLQRMSWLVAPRLAPARASWLDQAELLIHAFGDRYLKRSSWCNREEFIDHLAVSWREYNELYAYPFEWTWTNQKMRRWFERHRA